MGEHSLLKHILIATGLVIDVLRRLGALLSLGLWFGLVKCHPPLAATGDAVRVLPAAAATGFVASLLLYPFDFVRGSFAASRSLPLSTTVFTTVTFGSYWTCRDPNDPVNTQECLLF